MLQVKSRHNPVLSSIKRLGLVLVVAAAMAGCAPADPPTHTLTDAATGLGVTIKGNYLVEAEPPQGAYTAMIAIKSPDGHPFISEDTIAPICTAAFQPIPDNAGMTQRQINARVPEWAAQIESEMAAGFRFEAREPFEFIGLSGYRFIISPRESFSAKMRIVLYLMETPLGRTVLNCSGSAETLAAAMPTYELMRDALTPPGLATP